MCNIYILFSWHWKVKSEIIIIFIERTVFIKVFNCVRRIRKIYITEITCILLKWLKQRNKNSTRACVITLLPIWCHVSRLKEVSQAFFNEKFIWCNNKDLGNTSTGQHYIKTYQTREKRRRKKTLDIAHQFDDMLFVHCSMNIWLIMTEANDYDFEKVDDSLKCLKGVLVDSLRTVRSMLFSKPFTNIFS